VLCQRQPLSEECRSPFALDLAKAREGKQRKRQSKGRVKAKVEDKNKHNY